jgi:hypothetical protein
MDLLPSSGEKMAGTYSVGSIKKERANLNHYNEKISSV